jgi:phosphate uptake regulator
MERIGDYSKNIYDLTHSHPKRLLGGPLEEEVASVEKEALAIFDRTVSAFKASDKDAARAIMVQYKSDISKRCGDLERRLVSGSVEMTTSDAVTLALYLRFLKRISAHSRNLISSLVNPFDRIGYRERTE